MPEATAILLWARFGCGVKMREEWYEDRNLDYNLPSWFGKSGQSGRLLTSLRWDGSSRSRSSFSLLLTGYIAGGKLFQKVSFIKVMWSQNSLQLCVRPKWYSANVIPLPNSGLLVWKYTSTYIYNISRNKLYLDPLSML